MTLADRDVFQPASAPIVRAPRAGSNGQTAADEAWGRLVQQALVLGAPVSPAGTTSEPQALSAAPEPATPEDDDPRTVGVPGGRSVTLPTSPGDQDGIYRGLLWVAWAVEE